MFDKVKWTLLALKDYFKFLFFLISLKRKDRLLVFIGHDASSSGGASVVLNDLIHNLDTTNFKIIILYKHGGGLVRNNKDENLHQFVYQYFSKWYLKMLKKYNVHSILVNTVVCSNTINILQELDYICPIIWWLHEGKDLFDKFRNDFPRHLKANINVLCVSKNTEKIWNKYFPNRRAEIVHYGVKDFYNENLCLIKKKNKVFKIAVIGMICERKNQMQIIDLVNRLPFNLREKVEIYVVANTWDQKYKDLFIDKSKSYRQIKFIPGMQHNILLNFYNHIDLLLCCSKEDPLPVVVTEALMMKCACMVSSGCGQYQYIKNGVNGYKYNVNNINDLVKQLENIMNNRSNEKLKQIIENGRKVYLKEFSVKQEINKMASYLNLRN